MFITCLTSMGLGQECQYEISLKKGSKNNGEKYRVEREVFC